MKSFEHPTTPIIANDVNQLITFGCWGLLPSWTKDLTFRKNTLNAQIETVESLPSFRDYNRNRCLIPALRFYDWRHQDKIKIPYTIVSPETKLFSFA